MSARINALLEARSNMHAKAQVILDRSEAEQRQMTAAEQRDFDQLMADMALARRQVETLQESGKRDFLPGSQINSGGSPLITRGDGVQGEDYSARFRAVVANRSSAPIDIMPERDDQARSYGQPGVELRALSGLTAASGGVGYGLSIFGQVQRHLVNSSAILSAGATVIQSDNGEPLVLPKALSESSASLIAEAGTIPASDPSFGQLKLTSYKFGFLTQVSSELMNDSEFDVASYLAEQGGYNLANGVGAYFINGTGTSQPSGLLTTVPTGVTSATGVAGAPTVDNLIDLYASVPSPYARKNSSGWLMNATTFATVRKLKDTVGRYLLSTDVAIGTGADGELLGRPVYCDPNMPNVALNAKPIVFGDLSRYTVRQVGGIRFEQSIDFAFNTDLITFRCLARVDGGLADTAGAVRAFVGAAS